MINKDDQFKITLIKDKHPTLQLDNKIVNIKKNNFMTQTSLLSIKSPSLNNNNIVSCKSIIAQNELSSIHKNNKAKSVSTPSKIISKSSVFSWIIKRESIAESEYGDNFDGSVRKKYPAGTKYNVIGGKPLNQQCESSSPNWNSGLLKNKELITKHMQEFYKKVGDKIPSTIATKSRNINENSSKAEAWRKDKSHLKNFLKIAMMNNHPSLISHSKTNDKNGLKPHKKDLESQRIQMRLDDSKKKKKKFHSLIHVSSRKPTDIQSSPPIIHARIPIVSQMAQTKRALSTKIKDVDMQKAKIEIKLPALQLNKRNVERGGWEIDDSYDCSKDFLYEYNQNS